MCWSADDEDEIDDHPQKLPVVYSEKYGVNFCGIQKLHPFDAAKGAHILENLIRGKFVTNATIHRPTREITRKELKSVHTSRYLNSLNWSVNVARIAEVPVLIFVPNFLVQKGYLRPMRFQTAGSILASNLALHSGWAINLGGGFHHCSSDRGGGFCPYADITFVAKNLLGHGLERIMILDLDAHQGNGHERDFMDEPKVFIMDMYNASTYPRDKIAKAAIRRKIELLPFTKDDEYLKKLKINLDKSLEEFKPDAIVYNAGTDILAGDPLGLLSITPDGVITRDEIVFNRAIKNKIPIIMLLSGGYLRSSARVIADSILNLNEKGLLPMRH